jgi:hypothetical protein
MEPPAFPSDSLRDTIEKMKHVTDTQRLDELMRPLRDAMAANKLANFIPQYTAPAIDTEVFESIHRAEAEAREAPTARRAVTQLMSEIRAFEDELDEAHEVGIKLVPFGSATVIHVATVAFHQPSVIVLVGSLEDGSPVRVIQHLSQLNFLLVRAPRLHPDEPKRPIGFQLQVEA